MPLNLSVGISRKIGQPDYGSLGANCQVVVELDAALLREDLDAFHRHVRNAFAQCRQAVDEELAQAQRSEPSGGQAYGRSNGTNGNGHGNGRTNGRQATASQCRALRAIADRQRLDLTPELRNRFGVEHPEDLGISQASELIDAIKPQTNGAGGRR